MLEFCLSANFKKSAASINLSYVKVLQYCRIFLFSSHIKTVSGTSININALKHFDLALCVLPRTELKGLRGIFIGWLWMKLWMKTSSWRSLEQQCMHCLSYLGCICFWCFYSQDVKVKVGVCLPFCFGIRCNNSSRGVAMLVSCSKIEHLAPKRWTKFKVSSDSWKLMLKWMFSNLWSI